MNKNSPAEGEILRKSGKRICKHSMNEIVGEKALLMVTNGRRYGIIKTFHQ